MQIDKMLVQEFRTEVFQALKAIAFRHGLNVEQQHNITYSPTNFSIKFTFSDSDVDLNKVEWDQNCRKFGLQPRHYGATFNSDGKTYKITGINTRARTYPVEYLCDGKPMKAGAGWFKLLLTKNNLM